MTHDELQWREFGRRRIEFGGHSWRAKHGGPFGPGDNFFSETEENIHVDSLGRLHLRVTQRDGRWHCPELVLLDPLGYGDYIFKTVGRVDCLDPNLILGLFLWEYQESYEHIQTRNVANEFDIEFGTWKDPKRHPLQYVCQPWQTPGNEYRFPFALEAGDALTSHAFRWSPGQMECRSWLGHDDTPENGRLLQAWTTKSRDLPRLESPRVHINFWCIHEPPSDRREHEVVLAEFKFIPYSLHASSN